MKINFLRKARKPFVFDEAAGEYVNLKNGEVLSRSEFFEEMFSPIEKETMRLEKLVTPSVEENVNKLCEYLDRLEWQLRNGFGKAIEDKLPDLIVGETDLVKGAGTETKVKLARVPTIDFDPKKNWALVVQGIISLLIRLKRAVINNDPEGPEILDLGVILKMIGDGVIPITDTSRPLRDGADYKRLVIENEFWEAITSVTNEEIQKLVRDKTLLEDKIRSFTANLRMEVNKRRKLEDLIETIFVNGSLSVRSDTLETIKDFLKTEAQDPKAATAVTLCLHGLKLKIEALWTEKRGPAGKTEGNIVSVKQFGGKSTDE